MDVYCSLDVCILTDRAVKVCRGSGNGFFRAVVYDIPLFERS